MNERLKLRYKVQALARANLLLEVLATASEWTALGDISRAAGLKKTTAFNLLNTLVALGFAERDSVAGRYRLGLRNLELGRVVQRRLDIIEVGEAALVRLCAETRETVNLALPHLYEVLIVNSLEGNQGIRVTSYAGTRASYHSTACGKAMLAYMPDRFIGELLARAPLLPVTAHTIVNADRLVAELQRVRVQGFAAEREENEPGAACVAAVIRDGFGAVAGAISVAGPISRMTPDAIERIGSTVMRETAAISSRLGFSGKNDAMERPA